MVADDHPPYSLQQLLSTLLDLGRRGDFAGAKHLARRVEIAGYSSHQQVLQFAAELTAEDLSALIKAIAMFEDGKGGGGSISMNYPLLLGWTRCGDRATLDWVLRNCRWYYSKGAKSLEEYERIESREKLHREATEISKIERHLEAFRKKAQAATNSICGAIRRKDAKAIAALLLKGADPEVHCADGSTARGFAEATGDEDLHRILQELSGFHLLMRDLTAMGREGRFADAVELGRLYRSEQPNGVSTLIENLAAGFWDEMSPDDFDARAKALTMFEMGFGWQGEKSFVALLAYRPQGDNRLFDWVLRNTSGWHYAKGKKSLLEFEAMASCFAADLHLHPDVARIGA